MKKRYSASLILLAGLTISAEAHSGSRVFPIPELTDEMLEKISLDDGFIDEWEDLAGEPTMTLVDFRTFGNFMAPDPSNLDFRIWVAWHNDPDRIYVAFIASDDQYSNRHEYTSWSRYGMNQFDSISFVIDADHSGGKGLGNDDSTQEELLEVSGQTQRYRAIAKTVEGPTLDDGVRLEEVTEIPQSWRVYPPYGDSGGGVLGENPTISVIELYVTPYDWLGAWHDKEKSQQSDLAAEEIIGFAFIVYDRDGVHNIPWTPEAIDTEDTETDIQKRRADFFLDGLLLPADQAESGTAVKDVTWGRIKAALETE